MTVKLTTPKVKVFDQVEINIAAIAEAITFNTQITACEVTMPIQVTGSEIALPVDLQAAWIMCPMDIQAQYMNLAIDIVAQTIGNIAINIAGQIDDVTINVKAQSIGIFLKTDWETKEDNDKTLIGSASNKAAGTYLELSYTPAGKAFYITNLSFGSAPYDAANYDHFYYVYCVVYIDGIAETHAVAVGGNSIPLSKPLVVPDGKQVLVDVYNYANLNSNLFGAAWGYEE